MPTTQILLNIVTLGNSHCYNVDLFLRESGAYFRPRTTVTLDQGRLVRPGQLACLTDPRWMSSGDEVVTSPQAVIPIPSVGWSLFSPLLDPPTALDGEDLQSLHASSWRGVG